MVRPVKIGGGGGGTAHSRQLPGGHSHRAAPARGCPRQPPASVASSSSVQVSLRSSSSAGVRMLLRSSGEPRSHAPGFVPAEPGGIPRRWRGDTGRCQDPHGSCAPGSGYLRERAQTFQRL